MKIYLGLSLTTLMMSPSSSDLVIDVWEGGSTLYGWDVRDICIDRVPLIVSDPDCIKVVGGKLAKFTVSKDVIGDKHDIYRKLKLKDTSTFDLFWPARVKDICYMPLGGWCKEFRKMLMSLKSKILLGELKEIDLVKREIRVGWWNSIQYDELINTLPLDYFLTKLNDRPGSLKYTLYNVPFYIASFVLSGTRDDVRIIFLGKKKYASIAMIEVPGKVYGLDNVFIAYLFIPYETFKRLGAFREKAISDLKRLGIRKSDILVERGYYEKYGLIVGDVDKEEFKDYNIRLEGRLGSWSEKGICDVINEYLMKR